MGKVFINQDLLKIELTYVTHPGAVDHVHIKYKNPAGTIGEFPTEATHNTPGGSYYVIFSLGEFLSTYGSTGEWSFWLWFKMADGRQIPGEIYTEKIYAEGSDA